MRIRAVFVAATVVLCVAGCAKPKPIPLRYVSDRAERIAFGVRVRRTLLAGHFDKLDALADSLQRCDSRFENGVSRLFSFYFMGMRTVDHPNDPAEWEHHLDRPREWLDARPDSPHAPVALANALIGRGWAARGGGYAGTVSPKGWGGFEGDLQEAGQMLIQCADRSKVTPSWYDAMLDVIHGLSPDREDFDPVYAEAVARFPNYERFYLSRSWYLQPRWHGEPGEWEAEADSCAPALPDSLRDEVYARIVLLQSGYTMDVFKDCPTLDWERTQRGLEVWQRRYPNSPEPTSALAMFACQTGHRDVARAAFAELGNVVDVDVWTAPEIFLDERRKSETK